MLMVQLRVKIMSFISHNGSQDGLKIHVAFFTRIFVEFRRQKYQ